MILSQKMELAYYESPLLKGSTGLIHGAFTRVGGFSTNERFWALNTSFASGDERQNVVENIQLACAILHIDDKQLVSSNTKHGTDIFIPTPEDVVGRKERPLDTKSWPAADAIILTPEMSGHAAYLNNADCAIVLLHDIKSAISAILHAGWHGVAKGTATATVRRLSDQFGILPQDLLAVQAPSICAQCYVIASPTLEQREKLGDYIQPVSRANSSAKLFSIDLRRAMTEQLRATGIPQGNIDADAPCTSCATDIKSGNLLFHSNFRTNLVRYDVKTGLQLPGQDQQIRSGSQPTFIGLCK